MLFTAPFLSQFQFANFNEHVNITLYQCNVTALQFLFNLLPIFASDLIHIYICLEVRSVPEASVKEQQLRIDLQKIYVCLTLQNGTGKSMRCVSLVTPLAQSKKRQCFLPSV